MKFKYLIIAFSAIIIIIILIAALLPVFLAGTAFAVDFWLVTLPLLIFMFLLLAGMVVYFLLNYRLLSLLEREDWPALSYYLEQKIYGKGRYSNRKVRLLASSYLVVTDYASVIKLESKALPANPSVIEKNALIFGSARVLSGNYKEAAVFFKTYMEKDNIKDKQWLCWFYGFSQLLGSNFGEAETEFLSLAVSSTNAHITGLSSYFLDSSLAKRSQKPEECRSAAENGRSRIVKTIKSRSNWRKETEKNRSDIHIAIIRKYIDEAGIWLFNQT